MASIRERTRKDRTKAYDVRFRVDGRESSLPFNDRSKAERFCRLIDVVGIKRALEEVGVERGVRSRSHLTVREFLDEHISQLTGVERKTVDEYERYVKRDIHPTLGDINLANLSRADIARWVNDMADAGASGKTISNKHGFLSGALKRAVKDGLIPSNPCADIKLPRTARKEMVFLTHEEYRLLHDCFSDHYKPLVEFLVASGARFSEATALHPRDINHSTGSVRINKAWKRTPGGYEMGVPKTERSVRTINLPADVLAPLNRFGDLVFLNTAGKPVRVYGWRENVWYPTVKKAQEKGLEKQPRIHDLRHTCASWMIAAGIPLPVIQAHLGHESIKTTIDLYGHLDDTSRQAAAEAIRMALGRG
jgi:integrase